MLKRASWSLFHKKSYAPIEASKSAPVLLSQDQKSKTQIKVISQGYCLAQFSSEQLKKKHIYVKAIHADFFTYTLIDPDYPSCYGKVSKRIDGKIFFNQIDFNASASETTNVDALKPYLLKILRVISEQGKLPFKIEGYQKLYLTSYNQWRIKETRILWHRYFEKKDHSTNLPVGHYAFVKLASESYYRIWQIKNDLSKHLALADASLSVEYAGELIFDEKGNLTAWNNRSSAYPGDKSLAHQAGFPDLLFADYTVNLSNTLQNSISC